MIQLSDRKPLGMIPKLIFALAAFAAFCFVADFLLPVLMSVAFSYLLYPIVRLMQKIKLGNGRRLPDVVAVILAFLVFFFFLAEAIHILMVPVATQITTLSKALPGFAAQATASMNMIFGPKARSTLPPNIQSMLDQALSSVSGTVMTIAQELVTSTVRVARSMASMVLVPFLTFYFLKDWKTLKAMCIEIFPYDKQAMADRIITEIGSMLCTYVDNMLKLCLVAAACLTIGNYVLGVQYTLVLGLLAMLTEMIPLVGSVVGTVTAVFVALLQRPALALQVLILYLVYYQVDSQVIMPNLVGKAITLHPVLIILAVIIGGKIAGVVGLIFAVPVLAIIKILYHYFWHMGEKKPDTAI
jgi:predicted PurR-regulated permease PerM